MRRFQGSVRTILFVCAIVSYSCRPVTDIYTNLKVVAVPAVWAGRHPMADAHQLVHPGQEHPLAVIRPLGACLLDILCPVEHQTPTAVAHHLVWVVSRLTVQAIKLLGIHHGRRGLSSRIPVGVVQESGREWCMYPILRATHDVLYV